MNKKLSMLIIMIVCTIILSACRNATVDVTEEQKRFAEIIYEKAYHEQTISDNGYDYTLNFFQTFEENGKQYVEFMYTEFDNAKDERKTLGGAKVYSFGMGLSKYYEFTSGNIATSPTKGLLALKTTKKGLVQWDPNMDKEEMIKKLYELTQYLNYTNNNEKTVIETQYTETANSDIDSETLTDESLQLHKILFTNNLNWGHVYCYWYSNASQPEMEWPGEAMAYSQINDYGEPQFSIDIPKDSYCVFTNGTQRTQEVHFTSLSEQTGFYIDVESGTDSDGYYVCKSWHQ